MATETFTAYNTADTLIDSTAGSASGTSLYALTNTSYAYSGEIDNSVLHYPYGDIALEMTATVTTATPATLSVFLLPNVGSGNYAASSGNPGPGYYASGISLTVGAAVQYIQILRVLLTPYRFKIVVLNSLGATLPSNANSTLKLYRYGLAVA